jgi:hypothetical protein
VAWTLPIAVEDGDILDFPFDRHRVDFDVAARSGDEPVKVNTTIHHAPHGIALTHEQSLDCSGETTVIVTLTRSTATLVAVALTLLSLTLVSASALLVAFNVVVRQRKVEFNMMVWSAALLFVIPSVRNALPGGGSPSAQRWTIRVLLAAGCGHGRDGEPRW